MSPSFKQTHDSASESKPFQHYHHSGITPTSSNDDSEIDEFYREIQSIVDQTPMQDILVVQGGLECESWRRCTRRLVRSLWTFLQSGDQWQRAQAPRLRRLQQHCVCKHPRQPYAIQKVAMAQPRWNTSQPDWLHLGEETVPFRY